MSGMPPTLPRSDEAETGLLSCLMANPLALCPDCKVNVPDDHFHHAGYRLLYAEILAAHDHAIPISPPTLSQWMKDRGTLDSIGGEVILHELLDFNPAPAFYPHYIGILRDKWLLRRTAQACTLGAQKCYEHHENVPDAVASICGAIFDTVKPELSKGHKSFKTHVAEYVDTWQKRVTGEIEAGIPTRWTCFNTTFGGITKTMWVVAAFPSMGKSTLGQNMIEDVLAHAKHAIWYSYEMDETECMDRLMVSRTQIESQKVLFPAMHPMQREDERKISRAVTEMQNWGLHLRCEPTWTIEQIEADVKALCAKHPIGLVVIDYLQLVQTDKTFGTRAEQVAYISRRIKLRVSAQNRVAALVLSQLNDDGRILDSRAATQDGANIMTIEGEKGIKVIKNRNGPKGHLLPLRLNGALFTFEEGAPYVEEKKEKREPRKPYKT